MCRKVRCKKCGKASWAGCGAHVEQVLAGVPKADRCRCAIDGPPKATVRAGAEPEPSGLRRWLSKLSGD